MFDVVGIVGVGLIGGSIAIDMKKKGLTKLVLGVDVSEPNIIDAMRLGIIDSAVSMDDLGGCDLVVVSVPVLSIPDVMREVISCAKRGAVVMDVGSTKRNVVEAVKSIDTGGVHVVPAHPIAGVERFGPGAARENLFRDAFFIITPVGDFGSAEKKVKALFERLGSKVEVMSPERHDKIFSYISHLPHLLSYSLVGLIEDRRKNEEGLKFIGGGFKDFVRIAASSEHMWADIFIANGKYVVEAVDEFIATLERLKGLVECGDRGGIVDFLREARFFKKEIDEFYSDD